MLIQNLFYLRFQMMINNSYIQAVFLDILHPADKYEKILQ